MGLTRLELVTPSLSEKCSNHLSYRPKKREGRKRSRKRRMTDQMVATDSLFIHVLLRCVYDS
jgi:hypothetical protein